jgi:cytochrome b6-f complex iron-sulfur subunit
MKQVQAGDGADGERRPTTEPEGPPADTRRGFLVKLWLALGGVALAEYAVIALDLLRPRARELDRAGVVVAGPVDRFEAGSVTAFPQGRFYLVRLDDGGFLAVSRECTHLGCTVPWDRDRRCFVCPCHSSIFDIRGDVLNPPAPRALDRLALRIENNVVKVDVSRRLERRMFDPHQVTYA